MKNIIKVVLAATMLLSFSTAAFASTAVSDMAVTKGGEHVAACAQMMDKGVSECAQMPECGMQM